MGERIVITGSHGTIGTVLTEGLHPDYEITGLDLPENDVCDYQKLLGILPGHTATIHLAWDTTQDNWNSGKINPENARMFYNVFQAALEARVPRVIMASSVHADRYTSWSGPGLLSPQRTPTPDSPYGAHKLFMEAMGKYYATQGLQVVCIRFGWVNRDNKPDSKIPSDKAVFFSHHDCVSLVKTILAAKDVPNNFAIIYGVSYNKNRIHDVVNPFEWTPKEGAR